MAITGGRILSCPHQGRYIQAYLKYWHSFSSSFGMVGFGSPLDDLTVLKEMTNKLKATWELGEFNRSDLKKIGSLSTSLANMSSTLTKTQTLLTMVRGEKRTERSFTISKFKKDIRIPEKTWDIKTVRNDFLESYELIRCGKGFRWQKCPALLNPRAAGISFSNDPFDQGAERIVYQLHEIDDNGKFVGIPLVGKDSRYVNGDNLNQTRDFHFIFCKTKKIANNFAEKFNQWLDKSPKVMFHGSNF